MNRILHAIQRGTAEEARADGQLLEAYIGLRDGSAFAELVRRHGPMVWGVCRRMLPNHQDAEDAFQATFLVLVRKCASVRPAERVGNWLHGVAVRAAHKAAAVAARRRARPVEDAPDPTGAGESVWCDALPVLDEELSLLPERYRSVIILCDLEQKTRRAAAHQLGVPEGTVAGRLARARAMLGKRLARRGVGTPALAVLISERVVSSTAPASVVRTTIDAANRAVPAPVRVATLTEGVIQAMFFNKIKFAAIVLLVGLGVMASGAVLRTRSTAAAQPPRPEAAERVAVPEKGVEHPVGGQTVGYVRIDRDEVSASHYKALFGKTLYVLVEHFVQIYANPYDGRIEAAQQHPGGRTVNVEIRAAGRGGYLISVRVLRRATEGKPARRDVDLERTILRQLDARTEDLPPDARGGTVTGSSTPVTATGGLVGTGGAPQTSSPAQKPVASEDDQVRRLQKEVDELRERVRALERRPSDRESKDR